MKENAARTGAEASAPKVQFAAKAIAVTKKQNVATAQAAAFLNVISLSEKAAMDPFLILSSMLIVQI